VAELVESYVSLQQKIKEIQLERDDIREAIIDFCQSEGLSRVYGNVHAITYKLMERTVFSEEEVKALLEPEGLWDRVLSFDQARLKHILADGELTEDIKYRLEKLKRIVSTYPQLWAKKLAEEE